jgi:hypothetical protein
VLLAKLALPLTPTFPTSASDQPVGINVTVKFTPLLAWLDTVTTTFPVAAPVGTTTVIVVEFQQVPHGVAVVRLNLTVLLPCDDPKLLPVIVMEVPIIPEVGERLAIAGAVACAVPVKRNAKMTVRKVVRME